MQEKNKREEVMYSFIYNLKLSDRIYDCLVCKNSIDRDENSAINMKLLGSSSLSLDKLVSFTGNNKLLTFEYNL